MQAKLKGEGRQDAGDTFKGVVGEMIATFAKENNLAAIVGTQSAGRLLSGSFFKVGRG